MEQAIQPKDFVRQLQDELDAIAAWWLEHVVCLEQGTIAGEVSDHNHPEPSAEKSLVYVARLLWFFSAANRNRPSRRYRGAAEICYRELTSRFPDQENGGMVWSVDTAGHPVSRKKQCYGMCFAVYALTEYALTENTMSGANSSAMRQAAELVSVIETRMHDSLHGGYIEAMTADWQPLDDVRLGESDLNADKTMNTHLHVLEAWINVHRAMPGRDSAHRLACLIDLFLERFVTDDGYLKRFFTLDWREIPTAASYGHDIEASWLLWEAATVLGDENIRDRVQAPVITLAEAVLTNGTGDDGGVIHEGTTAGPQDANRIWWVQAEALVGFMNAWRITGDDRYLQASWNSWAFIREHQRDREYGEWNWFSRLDASTTPTYKAGFWKAPYHNGRAMLETLRRLSQR